MEPHRPAPRRRARRRRARRRRAQAGRRPRRRLRHRRHLHHNERLQRSWSASRAQRKKRHTISCFSCSESGRAATAVARAARRLVRRYRWSRGGGSRATAAATLACVVVDGGSRAQPARGYRPGTRCACRLSMLFRLLSLCCLLCHQAYVSQSRGSSRRMSWSAERVCGHSVSRVGVGAACWRLRKGQRSPAPFVHFHSGVCCRLSSVFSHISIIASWSFFSSACKT